jgi:hypothetical protein
MCKHISIWLASVCTQLYNSDHLRSYTTTPFDRTGQNPLWVTKAYIGNQKDEVLRNFIFCKCARTKQRISLFTEEATILGTGTMLTKEFNIRIMYFY